MEKVLEHVSENLSVEIFPDDKFEFLITTNEAAKGFGINPSSLRSQKHDHRDELIEGKHFITRGCVKTLAQPHLYFKFCYIFFWLCYFFIMHLATSCYIPIISGYK